MYKNHEYFLAQYYRIADLLALNFAFVLGLFLRFWNDPAYQLGESNYFSLLLFINVTWLFISNSQKIYSPAMFSSRNRYRLAIVLAILVQLLISVAFNGLIKTFYSRIFLFYTYLSFSFLLLFGRYVVVRFYKAYLKKRKRKSAIVVMSGNGIEEELLSYFEENISTEFQKVISIIESSNILSDLERIGEKHQITELYLPLSKFNEDNIEEITNFCDNNFIRLRIMFDWNKLSARKISATKLNQNTVFKIATTPLDDPYNAMLKRGFDIVFSLFTFIFLFSWLFPIIGILVKLSSKGPVFFKQTRSGMGNKEFACYKFRSMRQNKEADVKQATKTDPRITKVGRFLRRTSLDELPQFINVLKGEMSIVGPRPHMLKHTEDYSKLVGNFMERHAIKPGITGLAQIKGFRGEIDDLSLLQNRVRLDRFYVNNWTLFFDLKIVLFTVLTIFKDHK